MLFYVLNVSIMLLLGQLNWLFINVLANRICKIKTKGKNCICLGSDVYDITSSTVWALTGMRMRLEWGLYWRYGDKLMDFATCFLSNMDKFAANSDGICLEQVWNILVCVLFIFRLCLCCYSTIIIKIGSENRLSNYEWAYVVKILWQI